MKSCVLQRLQAAVKSVLCSLWELHVLFRVFLTISLFYGRQLPTFEQKFVDRDQTL